MNTPKDLKYNDSHEWVKLEGKTAYVGITDHAQNELGDIVFVDLPEIGAEFKKGDEVSSIESVKAAAPIYSPISGKIVKINNELDDKPELINEKPFESFIFALEISDPSQLDSLLSAAEYTALIEA